MIASLQYPIRGRRASELAGSVEEAVRSGRLAPGSALPTVRGLAAQLGVSPATVAAAYRILAGRGLVSGQGRRGTRLAPRPPLRTPPPAPLAAGLRDLASGNPDARLLPSLPLRAVDGRPRLYGGDRVRAELLSEGRRRLSAEGVPVGALTVVGGALDGLERVLQAHLRPGDRVAVEDPGYTGVLDLVAGLGLVPEGVPLDDSGPLPDALEDALRRGAAAVVVTPRAQNPTGAALDAHRARALGSVLDRHPDVLLFEDDHSGEVAGAPLHTLVHRRRPRWAVARSVSKALGPDLRLAFLAGDATTIARVEGRQHVGSGWVSHVLQQLVVALLRDRRAAPRLAEATRTYAERRQALIGALARHGIAARGRSGMNVWVPVDDEQAAVAGLAARGWAVRAGERYRLRTPPGIRITTAALQPSEARRVATDFASLLEASPATRTA
ncbi:MAG TPA: aminotransferase class I/II-fold pyridoxal phosphate-dependent enzyme [Vicinamibacteria bacterium]|nr:aminotransferase class I/II-fold pyridoxal phosphate-dependent enzyme [Vicinamibacteria bacterium]